jgi:hypothetical protein
MRKWLLLLCSVGLMTVARGDVFTFSTIPGDGNISGSPGATVGWGYSITNDSTTDWLGTLTLDAPSFLDGTANPIFDYPVIAPGATVTETFDASLPQGLYEFTWNSNAPIGVVNSGSFTISGDFYADENDANNETNPLSSDQESAAYSVTSVVSAIPEPSSRILLATVVVVIFLIRRFDSAGSRMRSGGPGLF